MKAQQLHDQSGENALSLCEVPTPKPGPNQVLIKVHATSLNYRDLMVCDGRYGKVALPHIPLSDGAGEVVELGSEVTQFSLGDRVASTFFQGWQTGAYQRKFAETALGGAMGGMLAEYVALDETGVVKIPDHLSYNEAATLPCAAVTAWNALVSHGKLARGQSVLILGTGGVSIFALQFAKILGAKTIVISSSDEKLARTRELGADETINYPNVKDWEKEVYRLTGKEGVDHVVEVVGNETLQKSLKCLATLGQIHVIGGVSGFSSEISLLDLIARQAVIHGVYVGSRAMFQEMNAVISESKLRPVIYKVFPFTDSKQAFGHLRSGGHFGKIVINIE